MKPPYLMQSNNIWRYNPPKDAVDEGVVKRASLGTDFAKACAYAEEQNKLMSEWRSERKYLKELTQKSRVDDLIKSYLTSNVFNKLGEKSRKDYKYYLQCWYRVSLVGCHSCKLRWGMC
jgi:hypothetical protein